MLAGVASVLRGAFLRRGYMALLTTFQDAQVTLRGPGSFSATPNRRLLTPTSSARFSTTTAPNFPRPLASSPSGVFPPSRYTPFLLASTTTKSASMSSPVNDISSAAAATPPPASTVEVRDTVALTPQEQELFDTLLAATRHAGVATVLRCAGGWVRDKLLGRDSHDIDIALDDRLGKDFAELVNDFLKAQGREARHAAVIQSNPDQSKHLETARMKIGEVWIDLVNLRSETYAADSRIPTMTFGTPEQDALRRDFTINALFYNITAGGVVEDLTGKGLQDLRDGLIRTPLPPLETFLDDPLRVLRAVRFGTRFGFRLHPDILEAAASEQVRVALATKISKERVGTELEGMFNGPAPTEAVRLLHRLGLFPTVFALPPPLDGRLGPSYGGPCCVSMGAAEQLQRDLGLELDKDERRFLLLAALLLPLRGLQAPAAKGKSQPATAALIRDSLKWRVKDIEMTAVLHDTAAELAAAHAVLKEGSGGAEGSGGGVQQDVRVMLGQAIRKLKQHWKLGIALAPVILMRAATPLGTDGGAASSDSDASECGGGADSDAEAAVAAASARVEMARELLAAVEAFGLSECWSWRPLMDGKKVMGLLGWSKPGPELGRVMAAVMDWQLGNPGGSAQQAEEMVKQRFGGPAGRT
ncbi:hypothetical protein Agub_g3403 [Astrephomene gubernaculifera]|uniref:Poly A polymerase head domain-containing protein n=1 Tax=Astrephomene gubernaculifera TaxID=47775 RepID=A0AAD3DMF1_9CHLO|nr:hypothetical protein Agub_g3403 [Astrephomene gubernaculifera]